jgi:hypothetical protein
MNRRENRVGIGVGHVHLPAKGGVSLVCLLSLFFARDVSACHGAMVCFLSGAPTSGGRAVVGFCGSVGSLLGHRRCPVRGYHQFARALPVLLVFCAEFQMIQALAGPKTQASAWCRIPREGCGAG